MTLTSPTLSWLVFYFSFLCSSHPTGCSPAFFIQVFEVLGPHISCDHCPVLGCNDRLGSKISLQPRCSGHFPVALCINVQCSTAKRISHKSVGFHSVSISSLSLFFFILADSFWDFYHLCFLSFLQVTSFV